MNYQRIYDQIIESAINNPKPDLYKENHHVVPRCMGGTNESSNIVKLTARQHFIAHWLLFKIYRTTKLAHAWFSMCRIGRKQDDRKINSKHFDRVRKIRSKLLSENSRGEKNHFYGKRHSDEILQRIREKNIGKKISEETRAKMSAKRKGVKKTDEHKAKIGRKGLISLRNIITGETVRIASSLVKDYDSSVWVNPYTYKLMFAGQVKCPHCGKVAKDTSTFKRWHFNNCKHKQIDTGVEL